MSQPTIRPVDTAADVIGRVADMVRIMWRAELVAQENHTLEFRRDRKLYRVTVTEVTDTP